MEKLLQYMFTSLVEIKKKFYGKQLLIFFLYIPPILKFFWADFQHTV